MADARVKRILERQRAREEKMMAKEKERAAQLRAEQEESTWEEERRAAASVGLREERDLAVDTKETSVSMDSELAARAKWRKDAETGEWLPPGDMQHSPKVDPIRPQPSFTTYAHTNVVESKAGQKRWQKEQSRSWAPVARSRLPGRGPRSSRESSVYSTPTTFVEIPLDAYLDLAVREAWRRVADETAATELFGLVFERYYRMSSRSVQNALYEDAEILIGMAEGYRRPVDLLWTNLCVTDVRQRQWRWTLVAARVVCAALQRIVTALETPYEEELTGGDKIVIWHPRDQGERIPRATTCLEQLCEEVDSRRAEMESAPEVLQCGWATMPPEVLCSVLSYLDVSSLFTCSAVCRYWKEVSSIPILSFPHYCRLVDNEPYNPKHDYHELLGNHQAGRLGQGLLLRDTGRVEWAAFRSGAGTPISPKDALDRLVTRM